MTDEERQELIAVMKIDGTIIRRDRKEDIR
jgi:hypothetical protein